MSKAKTKEELANEITNASAEHSIEISIEIAQKAVDKAEAIVRLLNNPDFKLVVVEGYFEKEPARLVGLLTDPEMSDPESQKNLHNDMLGISSFRNHLINMQRLGRQMAQSIKSSEEELDRLRDENL